MIAHDESSVKGGELRAMKVELDDSGAIGYAI